MLREIRIQFNLIRVNLLSWTFQNWILCRNQDCHFRCITRLLLHSFLGYYLVIFCQTAPVHTNWIGDVFLRGLNMVVVPLILLSITTGVASVGSGYNLGRLGLKTMVYYLFSTLVAILTGFFSSTLSSRAWAPNWVLKCPLTTCLRSPTVLVLRW